MAGERLVTHSLDLQKHSSWSSAAPPQPACSNSPSEPLRKHVEMAEFSFYLETWGTWPPPETSQFSPSSVAPVFLQADDGMCGHFRKRREYLSCMEVWKMTILDTNCLKTNKYESQHRLPSAQWFLIQKNIYTACHRQPTSLKQCSKCSCYGIKWWLFLYCNVWPICFMQQE